MLAYDDPDYNADPETAAAEILGYFMTMADERRRNPQDDLVTKLITADVDGHALSDDEFGYFTIILTVAGNETTRNAITHGMNAFFENPDQWDLYVRERPECAVDEIIRWATPVSVFQRTALRDVEVGGQEVKQGQRVGLFYASANFDADVFENPNTFDITRNPNPHLSFGGHGAHYCIGANLARMEVDLIFNAIADIMPDISKAAEPRRLRHALDQRDQGAPGQLQLTRRRLMTCSHRPDRPRHQRRRVAARAVRRDASYGAGVLDRAGAGGVRRPGELSGLLGGDPARRRRRRVEEREGLLDLGEHRHHPVRAGDDA